MLWKIFQRNSMICVDIGYRNIKIVEVDIRKKSDILIENYGIVPTPRGVIKNGAISDVPKVLTTIKEVIQRENMKAKNAKIIMSGTNIITRIYMMDKVDGENYDVTIKKDMPKYLPVNMDDYRVDYKILQVINERGVEKYKVFVTAVPGLILKSYVDVIKGLDLNPLAVDIPANSTAKFFNREIRIQQNGDFNYIKSAKGDVATAYAVLDFGSETTIVNFLKDRVLEFNKVILCGSSNVDEHLSRSLGIPIDEAERLKKMYGLVPPNNSSSKEHISAYAKVREFIERLVKQIVKCFEFYIERCYGTNISQIFLIGGGSQLKGLNQYLESAFKVPVYPIGLLNLKGVELKNHLDRERLYYLINSVGIAL